MFSSFSVLKRGWDIDGAAESVLIYRVRGISSGFLRIYGGGWVDSVLVGGGIHASVLSYAEGLVGRSGYGRDTRSQS